MYKKVRRLRVCVSLAVLAALTLGLCGAGGWVGAVSRHLSLMQILAFLSGGAVTWVVFWVAVTLVCGRVYCSTVCPAGTCMDIVIRLRARRLNGPLRQFSVARGYPHLRLLVLLIYIEGVALGVTAVTAWLDPYADFSRLFTVWGSANIAAMAGTAVVLVGGIVASWRGGRLLCNSVCPVGAALGGLSSVAVMGFDINPDLCVHCGACEATCKSRCINSDRSLVDNSRCVACFDCVAVCPNDAIRWTSTRHRLQWPLLMRADRQTGRATAAGAGPAAFDKSVKPTSSSLKKK